MTKNFEYLRWLPIGSHRWDASRAAPRGVAHLRRRVAHLRENAANFAGRVARLRENAAFLEFQAGGTPAPQRPDRAFAHLRRRVAHLRRNVGNFVGRVARLRENAAFFTFLNRRERRERRYREFPSFALLPSVRIRPWSVRRRVALLRSRLGVFAPEP